MRRAWPMLAALLLPFAATAQEVAVANGEAIPDLRPCVDGVARGSLRSIGRPSPIYDPDDLLGQSIHRYRFDRQAVVAGRPGARRQMLRRSGHALRDVRVADALVVTAVNADGTPRFRDWQWVWQDTAGRPFVPIFQWPAPDDRIRDWRPHAVRRFARPVRYSAAQPFWLDEDPADGLNPDLATVRGGRTYVRYGLYLSDIPAMLAAARSEPCWR